MRMPDIASAVGAVLLSCLLFAHCTDTGLPVQAGNVSIGDKHYYLYEYTNEDGETEAWGIEIQGDIDAPPSQEFEELTLEELHERGYLSTDEQVAQTPPEYVMVIEDGTVGRSCRSWLHLWLDPERPRQEDLHRFIHVDRVCRVRQGTCEAGEDRPRNEFRTKHSGGDRARPQRPYVGVWWRGQYNENERWKWHIHGEHYWLDPQSTPLTTDLWDEL